MPAIAPAPMTHDVRESVAWPRFSMQVLGVFGIIALTLAAMGIYGVTAFAVARRQREIGLRVALGAEPAGVRWMVMRASMVRALLGIGLGVLASLGVMRSLETVLYEVTATDPTTYLLVPGALGLVAVVSAWVPARRALRVQPRDALATE